MLNLISVKKTINQTHIQNFIKIGEFERKLSGDTFHDIYASQTFKFRYGFGSLMYETLI